MVFSIIASAFSTVASIIGPAVTAFCNNILPAIIPTIERIGETIKSIATTALSLLGIFKPGENVEEMGDRALQAAEHGIRPENYSTHDQYLAEIRNFKLDPEKSAKTTTTEKICSGLAMGTACLEKKLNAPEGSIGPMWTLAASNPEYFTGHRLAGIVQSGLKISEVVRHFEGKQGFAEDIKTQDALLGIERKMHPDKSDTTIYTEMMAARDAVEKFGKQS